MLQLDPYLYQWLLFGIVFIFLIYLYIGFFKVIGKSLPKPDSMWYTIDYPATNRFTYGYALGTYYLTQIILFLIPVVIWAVTYSFLVLYEFINGFFGGHYHAYLNMFPAFLPIFIGGSGIIEMIALLFTGFKIGYYLEEDSNYQILLIPIYVVLTDYLFKIWFFYNNPSLFSIFGITLTNSSNITLITVQNNLLYTIMFLLELPTIIIGVLLGNKYSKNFDELPESHIFMRLFYILVIFINIGFVIWITKPYNFIQALITQVPGFSISLIIYLFLLIYAAFALFYGDKTRQKIKSEGEVTYQRTNHIKDQKQSKEDLKLQKKLSKSMKSKSEIKEF